MASGDMKLDVYPTDGEAFETAAALIAERLRALGDGRPLTVALSGGRSGRGVMVALAARNDLPWERVEWLWADERCVPRDDPRSNVRLARDSLLEPRKIAPARIHPPPVEMDDAERAASAYSETLRTLCAGPDGPVVDLVVLGMGAEGHVASLMPGARALHATAPVAAVAVAEVTSDPRVARVTLTPPVLHAARYVIVVATGDGKAKAVAAAMRDPVDPDRIPAHLVRPSESVDWIVDRAAAAALLRDARPAPEQQPS
jgi:6-phosphogluconolactonase